jgi:hypothetical protein
MDFNIFINLDFFIILSSMEWLTNFPFEILNDFTHLFTGATTTVLVSDVLTINMILNILGVTTLISSNGSGSNKKFDFAPLPEDFHKKEKAPPRRNHVVILVTPPADPLPPNPLIPPHVEQIESVTRIPPPKPLEVFTAEPLIEDWLKNLLLGYLGLLIFTWVGKKIVDPLALAARKKSKLTRNEEGLIIFKDKRDRTIYLESKDNKGFSSHVDDKGNLFYKDECGNKLIRDFELNYIIWDKDYNLTLYDNRGNMTSWNKEGKIIGQSGKQKR